VMKSTVYRALEPTLQKMVYPYIGPAMRIECLGQAEWQKRERAARAVELGHPVEPTVYDFDKAFPPPLDVPTPEPVPTPVPRP